MNEVKFDDSMKKLFKVCRDIIRAKESNTFSMTKTRRPNPIVTYLNNYEKIYEKTDPSDHIPDVIAMFKRHRVSFLKKDDDSPWIKDKTVFVQFGDGTKETKDCRIMLSSIYINASQVKLAVEEKLKGLPQDAYEGKVELVYPSVLKLHIYRLVYEALGGKDEENKEFLKERTILIENIRSLENDLGIVSEDQINTTPEFSLGGIIKEATNLAKQNGIISPDAKGPSNDDLGKMIGNFFNNPKLKEVLGSLMGDFQGGKIKDSSQIFSRIGDSIKQIAPHLTTLINENNGGGASTSTTEDNSSPSNEKKKDEEKSLIDI